MNGQARSPFLVLLQHELGCKQLRGVELVLALTFFYAPWLGLNLLMFALGHDLTAFYPGMLGVMLLFWLMGICALTAYPQVPVVWSNLTTFKQFEFQFTRAIDRRLNFRAKAAATLLVVLAPQLPGLVWSLAQPDMVVTLDVRAGETEAQRDFIAGRGFPTARYFQAFPGSERLPASQPEERGRLRLRHGWLVYAWWMAGTTTLLTALFFAYYALVGRHLPRTGWWANTVLVAPVPVVLGALIFPAWRGMNPGDELLLGWQHHWPGCLLLVAGVCYGSLRWCEQRFANLEIL